jgi:hypothetical protein
LIINEVYFTVDPTTEEEGKNEWVEIYNPNNSEVDLKGSAIKTSDGEYEIKSRTIIPAFGFVLLSHDNSIWKPGEIPGDAGTINLGGSPDDWLANSGDTVQLLNTDGNPVDEVTYGSGGVNINGLLVGQSIQRIETAHDTDTPSDWKINPSPNPGI